MLQEAQNEKSIQGLDNKIAVEISNLQATYEKDKNKLVYSAFGKIRMNCKITFIRWTFNFVFFVDRIGQSTN